MSSPASRGRSAASSAASAISVYFAAGGLLTAAWVNVVQLTVKIAGFAVALPLAVSMAGGWGALAGARTDDPAYLTFWRPDTPGLMYLPLLVPAFIVSPGLLQKIFGARDDRAVRIGVGLNALGLFLYAGVPAVLGIVARLSFPDLANANLALPMVLMLRGAAARGCARPGRGVLGGNQRRRCRRCSCSRRRCRRISTSGSWTRPPATRACCGSLDGPRS